MPPPGDNDCIGICGAPILRGHLYRDGIRTHHQTDCPGGRPARYPCPVDRYRAVGLDALSGVTVTELTPLPTLIGVTDIP